MGSQLDAVITYIVRSVGRVEGKTRLMKLVYLTDLAHMRAFGTSATGAHWFRYEHGPFSKDVLNAAESLNGVALSIERKVLSVSDLGQERFDYVALPSDGVVAEQCEISDSVRAIVDPILNDWAHAPLKGLLRYVYDSEPFKRTARGEDIPMDTVAPKNNQPMDTASQENKPKRPDPARTAAFLSIVQRVRRNIPRDVTPAQIEESIQATIESVRQERRCASGH